MPFGDRNQLTLEKASNLYIRVLLNENTIFVSSVEVISIDQRQRSLRSGNIPIGTHARSLSFGVILFL